MFTGIVQASGKIGAIRETSGDWRLTVSSTQLDFSDVVLGDSIAVSGVCLTAVATTATSFDADVSRETLACTTLGTLQTGALVNLEKALTPHSRLGGHIVSGHVDGIAELCSRKPDARSERLVFRVPAALARYIAHKGSVCLDGVSLTVNAVSGCEFGVNIIPHTAERTTLHGYKPGQRVNLEVDVISRYLERLLLGADAAAGDTSAYDKLTYDKLLRTGFAGG
jgi:riboflavin synthase